MPSEMITVKVLFQGFDCKTFENTCWFPPAVPEHHDAKSNDSKGSFQINIYNDFYGKSTDCTIILVFNGDPAANYSGQPLTNNSEFKEIINSLFLNSIWSF